MIPCLMPSAILATPVANCYYYNKAAVVACRRRPQVEARGGCFGGHGLMNSLWMGWNHPPPVSRHHTSQALAPMSSAATRTVFHVSPLMTHCVERNGAWLANPSLHHARGCCTECGSRPQAPTYMPVAPPKLERPVALATRLSARTIGSEEQESRNMQEET